jgi:outer membrane protein assembly factor BamB
VIYDGKVVIQCDVQKGSFIGLFDLEDGREIWRTVRNDVPTWSTPLVVATREGARIYVNGWKHSGGYDFATGREVWKLNGGGDGWARAAAGHPAPARTTATIGPRRPRRQSATMITKMIGHEGQEDGWLTVFVPFAAAGRLSRARR